MRLVLLNPLPLCAVMVQLRGKFQQGWGLAKLKPAAPPPPTHTQVYCLYVLKPEREEPESADLMGEDHTPLVHQIVRE